MRCMEASIIDHRAFMPLGIGFLMLSIGLSALTGRTWRTGVPAIELVALRLLGRQPTPRTAWDQRIALFNACACTVLGSFIIFGGLTVALFGSAE